MGILGGTILCTGLPPTFKTTGTVPCNWDNPKMSPHISKRPLGGIFARDEESPAHPRRVQETGNGGGPLTGRLRMMPRSTTSRIWTMFPGNGAPNELVNRLGALDFDSRVRTPTPMQPRHNPGFRSQPSLGSWGGRNGGTLVPQTLGKRRVNAGGPAEAPSAARGTISAAPPGSFAVTWEEGGTKREACQ